MLSISPKQLREGDYQDGEVVRDMLEERCLGKEKFEDGYRYWYGPCKHLSYNGLMASCNINDKKPRVCKGYPDYHKTDTNDPVVFKGCGYYVPGTKVLAAFEERILEPLTDEDA